jgi:hypothetical protein
MTISAACKDVGLPRSSYYDIINKNPEAIAKVQVIIEVYAHEQLGLILSRKNEILWKVIEDGLSNDTKPRDRLVIYKTLTELEERYTNSLQIESEAAAQAHEFLKQGPKTSIMASRLTVTQEEVTPESEPILEAGSTGE